MNESNHEDTLPLQPTELATTPRLKGGRRKFSVNTPRRSSSNVSGVGVGVGVGSFGVGGVSASTPKTVRRSYSFASEADAPPSFSKREPKTPMRSKTSLGLQHKRHSTTAAMNAPKTCSQIHRRKASLDFSAFSSISTPMDDNSGDKQQQQQQQQETPIPVLPATPRRVARRSKLGGASATKTGTTPRRSKSGLVGTSPNPIKRSLSFSTTATTKTTRSTNTTRAGAGAGADPFFATGGLAPKITTNTATPKSLRTNSINSLGLKRQGTNAALDFTVNIIQGEGLVACDTNIFGKPSASDPYVIVSLVTTKADEDKEQGDEAKQDKEEIPIGTTKHIVSNLNPKWNATLNKLIPPGKLIKNDTYSLQLQVMDYDFMGDDTCMGIVNIPLTVGTVSKTSEWYEIPEDSAATNIKASGRIQVAIETKLQYTMDSFLANHSGRRGSQNGGATGEAPDNGSDGQKEEASVPMTPRRQKASAASSFFGGAGTAASSAAGAVLGGAGTAAGAVLGGAGTAAGAVLGGAGTAASTAAGAASSAATAMAGMFSAPTTLFGMGKTSQKEEAEEPKPKEEDQYVGICKDEEVLSLMVTVHRGDGLVAKDKNALGRHVSSDPYVVAEVWPKGVPMDEDNYNPMMYPKLVFGRSQTIHKNLSPVWNASFDFFSVPMDQLDMDEAHLRIRIMDDDFGVGEDDPMGNVDVHLQPKQQVDIQEKWYQVSRTSASRASGRVQISLLTIHAKQKTLVGQKKKEPTVQELNDDSKMSLDQSTTHDSSTNAAQDEMAASMPARFSFLDGDATSILMMAADNQRRSTTKGKKRSMVRKSVSNPEGHAERTGNHLRNIKEGMVSAEEGKQQRRCSTDTGAGLDDEEMRSSKKRDEMRSSRRGGKNNKNNREEGAKKRNIRRTRSSIGDGNDDPNNGPRVVVQRSQSVTVMRKSSHGNEMGSSRRGRQRRDSETGAATATATKKRTSTKSGGGRTVRSKENIGESSRRDDDTITTASTSSHVSSEENKKRVSRSGRFPSASSATTTPKPTKQRISRSKSAMDGSSMRHHQAGAGGRRLSRKLSSCGDRRTSLQKALDASTVSNTGGTTGGGGRRIMDSSVLANSRRMDASVMSSATGGRRMDASVVSSKTSNRRASSSVDGSSRGEGVRRKGRRSSVERRTSSRSGTREKDGAATRSRSRSIKQSKGEDTSSAMDLPELKAIDSKTHIEPATKLIHLAF